MERVLGTFLDAFFGHPYYSNGTKIHLDAPLPPPPPPTNKLFSCYYPIKTSFIALAIAPVPFLFNSILFVQTGHANFDFN